jgi:catechol 2,3-dioxygenase-like lactoylglutathione lyase family enzyme
VSSTPPTKGIRHLALRVKDLPREEAFYRDVLGYREEWRPSERELYLTRGTDNLALHAGAPSVNEGDSKLDHFGLLMARVEDVDSWAQHLRAHGVPLDTEPRTHRDGARSFYARDPEGNRIQFIWHPPLADT